MDTLDLCVAGLDSAEISQKLEPYVAGHFPGYKLGTGQSMFMEGHVFCLEELDSVIPDKYHHFFNAETKFNCMSGYITVGHTQGKPDERTVMAVMDSESQRVYFFCLEEEGEGGELQTTLIKDFLSPCGTHKSP